MPLEIDVDSLRLQNDYSRIPIHLNPNFIILLRFLTVFQYLHKVEWTFREVEKSFTAPQISPFLRSLVKRFFYLLGKKLSSGRNNAAKISTEFIMFKILDASNKAAEPLVVSQTDVDQLKLGWDRLTVDARLRCVRAMILCVLSSNKKTKSALKNVVVSELAFSDSSLGADADNMFYWYFSENNGNQVFRIYKENENDCSFALVAEDVEALERLIGQIDDKLPLHKALKEMHGRVAPP